MTRTVQATLDSRIKSYVDVLRGTASLFRTSAKLDRKQFHEYVHGLQLDSEFPGIETVNFARYFTDQERPAFEAMMKRDLAEINPGYPEFRIVPPGQRPEYSVLTYIEPIDQWSNRFGTDLQARASVALAMSESRDTEQPSASGTRVPLKTTSNGLAMRLPVYRAGMPHRTIEERRAAYIGTVGIGFSVERLVQGVLDDLPVRRIRLIISGMSPDEQPDGRRGAYRRVILYDNFAGGKGPAVNSAHSFHAALPMGNAKPQWTLDFAVDKAEMYSGFDALTPWLAAAAGGGGCALLYALFHALSTSRRRALELANEMTRELRASESKIKRSNERLRRLAAHAENIKEVERKRIAREIHDDLGQNLLALRIEADMLSSRTAGHHPRLHARAQWTLEQIDATIRSVRQIINDLRPTVLDLGLDAAVDWQVSQFERRSGIACQVIRNGVELHLSDTCATALFRILQESLNNVSRHAHATKVKVELQLTPEQVSLSVTDNGIGLPSAVRHKPGSFGLAGIEERVKMLGGEFNLISPFGGGTILHVSLPTSEPEQATPGIRLHADAPAISPA
ncbi:MAG: sensor histidine kinase [Telluria sp.]